ncbi:UDP-glycosyltransferase 86A2 [Mercurialis annua]|uniref:UDP-glycosyltransferase 86A2 n=1 Tax=Mercurialis annua TaxID=3986 RepID=UPI00215F258B|nr:UDP-glycosyltransferase 86A2 [Mercurialis annua]
MEDKTLNTKPHAIFIPYPLQGHLIPSAHLAMKLASQGFTITFINTYAIHHQTSKAAQTKTGAGPDMFAKARESGLDIRYKTVSDGLPVAFDRSLNHDQFMAALLHVFSAHVEEAVAEIVSSGEDVHCLIADTFFVWPSKIAYKFGLLHISFWTEPALVFTLYYHVDLLRLNCHFACQDCREDTIDYIPGVKGIEPKDTMSYLQETETTSVCHQIIFNSFNDTKKADFVICNSVQELEPTTISALQHKIPFYAIGPTFFVDFSQNTLATSLWSESDCNRWLDDQPDRSVLYVSFGSYAHITKHDLTEIANGLAQSKVSFLWVLRPDIVSSDDLNPLPQEFLEEVSDRSIIVPWCSQHNVLTHRAIGGFLTHCGWNSTLESIWCEVPLLCFPLYTDQFTNRKLVVDDWKIGINMTNRKLIFKEDVSRNIDRLMCGKSRDAIRDRIKGVKKILENAVSPSGSSKQNMAQFIKDLKDKIEKKKTQSKKSICNGT